MYPAYNQAGEAAASPPSRRPGQPHRQHWAALILTLQDYVFHGYAIMVTHFWGKNRLEKLTAQLRRRGGWARADRHFKIRYTKLNYRSLDKKGGK